MKHKLLSLQHQGGNCKVWTFIYQNHYRYFLHYEAQYFRLKSSITTGERKKKRLFTFMDFSPSLHLPLFMFKWVEINLFVRRSGCLQHALCLNKPLASEAFFRLSVSPSPSPWAPIDISSHFCVWHLKKQLKRIAPICKRKATFLKDKTGFSLGVTQTPQKMVSAPALARWTGSVYVRLGVALCVCSVYMFEHTSLFASCVMFNFALP